MDLTAYISDTIGTIATKFTVEMPAITSVWSIWIGQVPLGTDQSYDENNGKKWSFFRIKSVPFWGWSWRSCCNSVQLHPIKLFFWPNRLKISFFYGFQQQFSGVSSWCRKERVKHLIRAWWFPSRKYLKYYQLAGHDVISAWLSALQYSLTQVSIFINNNGQATLPHSCKARVMRCKKS